MPVTRIRPPISCPETPPIALSQTAEWLDLLKKTDLVQSPALEDFHERLEQLRQQPARDWYNQSSLEAGDNLHGQTEQSLQALQRDLRTAASSLETMERITAQTSPAEAKAMADRMQRGTQRDWNWATSRSTANYFPSSRASIRSMMKSLTPEQLEKLKAAFEKRRQDHRGDAASRPSRGTNPMR